MIFDWKTLSASPLIGCIVGHPEIEPFARDWRYIAISLTIGKNTAADY
jgi:hypothetical protein